MFKGTSEEQFSKGIGAFLKARNEISYLVKQMVINEIFPNPTVKEVAFEIKFPNLFYIENKIGDLQVRIIEKFPESALVFRRPIFFQDLGSQAKLEEIRKLDDEYGKKIWQFKSDKKCTVSVMSNSLNIISLGHKTYNLGDSDKFRDVVSFVLGHFLEITAIPIINRIGLRYVDECPLPSKDNETFQSYFNSTFPIDRFNIADATEMVFRTVVKKGDFSLIYMEGLKKEAKEYKLVLDFDGFATKIRSEDYLVVTDELHKIISEEYVKTIKEPVYQYMRQGRDENV